MYLYDFHRYPRHWHLYSRHFHRYPRHLHRYHRHLHRYHRHLHRYSRHLHRYPRYLHRYPRHLHRYPRHLHRYPRHLCLIKDKWGILIFLVFSWFSIVICRKSTEFKPFTYRNTILCFLILLRYKFKGYHCESHTVGY